MGAVEKGKHMMMISYNLHGMTLPRYDSDEYDDLDDEDEEGEAENEASSEVPNEFFI